MQALSSDIFGGYELLPSESPDALVFFLHGVGSNGGDLMSLAPYYQNIIGGGVGYISMDAPFEFDMAPSGYGGAYQWFSLSGYDPTYFRAELFLDGVREAHQEFVALLEEQRVRFNLAWERIVLVGFSQGTMVSLYSSLVLGRVGNRLGAVVGYSGGLVGVEDYGADKAADKAGAADAAGDTSMNSLPPYLLVHGDSDEVVSVLASRDARDVLVGLGCEVSLQVCDGLGHSISEAGIFSGANFIKKSLQKS